MRLHIAIWASAGFLVAAGWAVYALATQPPAMTSADPVGFFLVRLTCPIAILSFYPIRLYWVLVANAATYGLIGLIVETMRQRVHRAR